MPSWFCVPVSSRSGAASGAGSSFGTSSVLEKRAAAAQHADVGAVELVGRAGEEVAAERPHVHERVGRVVDGVHEDEGALGVGELRRRRHVVDRAERVRRGADGEEPGPRARSGARGRPVELARRRAAGAPSGTVTPRSVPSARQGSTLAWWSSSVTTISSPGPQPRPRARARWKVSVVMLAPKAISSARAAQEVGEGLRAPRASAASVSCARRVVPVGVGVVVEQVVGHGVHDRSAAPGCRRGRRSRRPGGRCGGARGRERRRGSRPRSAATGRGMEVVVMRAESNPSRATAATGSARGGDHLLEPSVGRARGVRPLEPQAQGALRRLARGLPTRPGPRPAAAGSLAESSSGGRRFRPRQRRQLVHTQAPTSEMLATTP